MALMTDPKPCKLAFLYIGGGHQALHTAPIAAELANDPRFAITCYVAGDEEEGMLARTAAAWGVHLDVRRLAAPWPLPLLRRIKGESWKYGWLWANVLRLRRADAIVVPERTSSLLKQIGLKSTRMIYVPHGGGDRAVGFEPRITRYDYVLAPGQKNADRMMAAGVAHSGKIAVAGWVKLGAVARFRTAQPRLFGDNKPVVVYNPHFRPQLSSWPEWGKAVVEAFAAQNEFHLILAPHIRLFRAASRAERASIEALSVPGHILVDAGSTRSCDMTYTLAADVYLGDVSSQLYEFLSMPRPCAFLNAHHVHWQNDRSYAGWHLGEVIDAPDDLFTAIRRAVARHVEVRNRQVIAMENAAGPDWLHAPERAARLLADFLLNKPRTSKPK